MASWISLSGDPIADETTKKENHETEGQTSKSIEENATTEVTGQQSKESNPAPDKPVSSTVPDAEVCFNLISLESFNHSSIVFHYNFSLKELKSLSQLKLLNKN